MIDIRSLRFQSSKMEKRTMRPTFSRVKFEIYKIMGGHLFWPAQILMNGADAKVMHLLHEISPGHSFVEFKLIYWKWKWSHVLNLTMLNIKKNYICQFTSLKLLISKGLRSFSFMFQISWSTVIIDIFFSFFNDKNAPLWNYKF